MAHARKAIRDRVVTVVTGLSTTGSNVEIGRTNSVSTSDLPALYIYSGVEEVLRTTLTYPSELTRHFNITIEAVVSDSNPQTAENTIDTILAEVETALSADNTLSANVKDFVLASVEVSRRGDQERSVLVMAIEYVFEYMTAENDPTALL
jgi:hypothetical protein